MPWKGEYYPNGRPVHFFKGLDGKFYKSKGERDVADWMYLRGIEYSYEEPYPVDTRTPKHRRQYRPDFHIDGTDVYVEYYGTDRQGNVPGYFDAEDGKTAGETYADTIRWKRDLHRRNGTKLVELFAWQRSDGSLGRRLRRGLRRNGVKVKRRRKKS